MIEAIPVSGGLEIKHQPVVVRPHMGRFGLLARDIDAARMDAGIREGRRALEHAHHGRAALRVRDDLEIGEARSEEVLVDLDVRANHRHCRARLADQSADRREADLERVHADFGAGGVVLIDDRRELDDRPGIAFEREGHVAELELGARRHRGDDDVADLRADERQRQRVHQQHHIQQQHQAEWNAEQPSCGETDGSSDRTLADRLTWWRRGLQLCSAGVVATIRMAPGIIVGSRCLVR